jgi:uncharacterized protein YbjT (DUF2867 family)
MSSGQAPASGPARTGNGSAQPARVLVTGATGTTGTRLVPLLVADGYDVIVASRRGGAPDGATGVRFDWHDPASHAGALAGVELMYLIPPVRDPQPELAMVPFLRLAHEAGVRRVVLHSGSPIPAGGPGVGIVHQALPDLFDEWAVLRPSWFMQNFIGPHPYARMIRETGSIPTATGEARVGFIDAGDIARVAAVLLAGATAPNTDFVLTGPETLSFTDAAKLLSQASRTTITHEHVDRDVLAARYEQIGFDAATATFVGFMDMIMASGAEDRTTDAVEQLTGAPPRSFAEFASAEFSLEA